MEIDYTRLRMYSIVGIICVIFSLLVMNAYKFLPESDNNSVDNNITVASDVLSDDGTKENPKENDNMAGIDSNEDILNALEGKNSSDSSTTKISAGDKYKLMYKEALELKKNSDYKNSSIIASNALQYAQNDKDYAACYELIALNYASMNYYNSALDYAQKAYNASPSTSIEILIAKLNYKNGDFDKSKEIIDKVLNRDFSEDN